MLKSERVVIESPMSLAGSRKRLAVNRRVAEAMAPRTGASRAAVGILLWVVLMSILAAWWAIILVVWYPVMLTIFFVPFMLWRGFRRNSRGKKATELRHRELLDAVKRQD